MLPTSTKQAGAGESAGVVTLPCRVAWSRPQVLLLGFCNGYFAPVFQMQAWKKDKIFDGMTLCFEPSSTATYWGHKFGHSLRFQRLLSVVHHLGSCGDHRHAQS
jgi:hypothetical protein